MSEFRNVDTSVPEPWHKRPWARFGLWAAGGGVVGYGAGQLLAEYEDRVPVLAAFAGWARGSSAIELVAALAVFVMVLIGGGLIGMGRHGDDRLRRMLKMDSDDNPDRMRRMIPVAGWGMLLYALLILLFLIPGIPPAIGIGLGVASFTAVTWLFHRGTASMDEMEQLAQREAMTATFLILEAVGIGWALLNHFGLAPAMEPVAVVLLLTLVYYGVGTITGYRRGLGR